MESERTSERFGWSLERGGTLSFRFLNRRNLAIAAALLFLWITPLQVTLFLLLCLSVLGLAAAIAVEIRYPPSVEEEAQYTPLNLDERRRW